MTEKRTTLGDFAHVFHGVGNANIFAKEKVEGVNKKPDVTECGVIKATDITSQRPWFDSKSISRLYVARRVTESKKMRGLGQSCLLQPGDVLLSTRGIPRVSPSITHEIVQRGSVVAGPEIIVIRAKDNVHPAALRRALKSEAARDYFVKNTTRKNQDKKAGEGWDKSGVLSKEAAVRLPLPADIETWKPRFEEPAEVLSHKAEYYQLILSSLSHAIIELSRWRLEKDSQKIIKSFDLKLTKEFSWSKKIKVLEADINKRIKAELDKIDQNLGKDPSQTEPGWEWYDTFDKEKQKLFDEKVNWMADGISHCLDQIAAGSCTDEDTELLCRLLVGETNPVAAREALTGESELVESLTMEVHQGHERASPVNVPKSVRKLLASFAISAKNVVIPSSETGHLAFDTLVGKDRPSRLTLIEQSLPYRKVAESLAKLAGRGTKIESYEYAHMASWHDVDVALIEASTVPLEYGKTEYSATELASMTEEKALGIVKQAMPWSNLGSMKSGSIMVAYIPTDRWRLLLPVRTQISVILQLPPLSKPTWSGKQDGKYASCDQGLLVLLHGGMISNEKTLKIIDATRLNKGEAATELTSKQIKLLNDLLLGKLDAVTGTVSYYVTHETIPKDMSVWPSMISLIGKQAMIEELTKSYSLETLVEEYKYRYYVWNQTQAKTFNEIGLTGVIPYPK